MNGSKLEKKPDVVKVCAKPQMCGHKSGSEAAIHAMKRMHGSVNTDAVLFLDTENTFNSLNRKAWGQRVFPQE